MLFGVKSYDENYSDSLKVRCIFRFTEDACR